MKYTAHSAYKRIDKLLKYKQILDKRLQKLSFMAYESKLKCKQYTGDSNL